MTRTICKNQRAQADNSSTLRHAIHALPAIGKSENILNALERMQNNIDRISKRGTGRVDVVDVIESESLLGNLTFGIRLLAAHGLEFDGDPFDEVGKDEYSLRLVSAAKLLKRYPDLASFAPERFEGMVVFKLSAPVLGQKFH